MDHSVLGLPQQQACESASKIREEEELQKKKERGAKRFGDLSLGCLLYALFYTLCLYRNQSGITAPFFVGGTLFFLQYCFRKSGVTAVKGNRFWMAALVILGIVTCTTDSEVLIHLNRMVGIVLVCVLLLQSFQADKAASWSIGTWCKSIMHLICGSFGQIGKPFVDGKEYVLIRRSKKADTTQKEKQRQIMSAVLIGIGVSIPILCFVGILLLSADALFYQIFSQVFEILFTWKIPKWLQNGTVVRIGFMIAGAFLYSYAVLVYCQKKKQMEDVTVEKKTEWDSYIAITFTAMIAILYCVFDFVQIFGLFLGKMQLPEGYTYASYARQGFFQLLFVSLFNICLVPSCLAFFKKSHVLDILLTVICGCTYIMIASSAYRMLLYIASYDLTFLRLFVLWALAMLAVLMAGVIYYIYHLQFGLFRYLLAMVTVGYLCFAAIHPDYWIARYNISRLEQGEMVDTWYLQMRLSADAAPAIAALDDKMIDENVCDVDVLQKTYFTRMKDKTEDMHIRDWNVSRAVARSLTIIIVM